MFQSLTSVQVHFLIVVTAQRKKRNCPSFLRPTPTKRRPSVRESTERLLGSSTSCVGTTAKRSRCTFSLWPTSPRSFHSCEMFVLISCCFQYLIIPAFVGVILEILRVVHSPGSSSISVFYAIFIGKGCFSAINT